MTLAIMTSPLFLKIAIFPGLTSIAIIAALLTWLDRKITARVQLRIGPQYVSPLGGILQSFADLIKIAFKELPLAENADKFFFVIVLVFVLFVGGGQMVIISFSHDRLKWSSECGGRMVIVFCIITSC